MESDQIIVEDAEALFLSGEYRKALFLCNNFLTTHTESHECSDEAELLNSTKLLRLRTPLHLSIDAAHRDRRLLVQVVFPPKKSSKQKNPKHGDTKGKDVQYKDTEGKIPPATLFDRAATVALQSWYEISSSLQPVDTKSHPSNTEKPQKISPRALAAKGYIHLLPFLDAFDNKSSNSSAGNPDSRRSSSNKSSSNRERSMPLELAVIYVRFLRTPTAGSHIHEAVELSCEILWRILGSSQFTTGSSKAPSQLQPIRQYCEELFSLVFVEVLPFAESQNDVLVLLKRFATQNGSWKPASYRLKISRNHQLNSEAILALLSFLNKTPDSWFKKAFPGRECIAKSIISLRRLLRIMESQQNRQSEEVVSPVPPCQNMEEKAENLYASNRRRRQIFKHLANQTSISQADPLEGDSMIESNSVNRNVHPTKFHFLNGIWMKFLHQYEGGTCHELLQNIKERKPAWAFVAFMLLLSWKKRRRVAFALSKAFRICSGPVQEVVDALIKPS